MERFVVARITYVHSPGGEREQGVNKTLTQTTAQNLEKVVSLSSSQPLSEDEREGIVHHRTGTFRQKKGKLLLF